jgi:hypothetical protein
MELINPAKCGKVKVYLETELTHQNCNREVRKRNLIPGM